MTCKCHPSSPFLWRDNKSELDIKKMSHNAVMSGISSARVNTIRKTGIEPMSIGIISKNKPSMAINPSSAQLQPTIGRRK